MDPDEVARIRAKRLQKLQEAAAQNMATVSASQSSSASASASASELPSQPSTKSAKQNLSDSPASSRPALSSPPSERKIERAAAAPSSAGVSARSTKPAMARPAAKAVPFEEWQDRVLTDVFRCTIRKTSVTAEIRYLADLAANFEAAEQPALLAIDHVDSILIDSFRLSGSTDPLDFIFSSWLRADKKGQAVPSREADGRKGELVDQIMDICVTYFVTALAEPEAGIFEIDYDPVKTLAEMLAAPEAKIMNSNFLNLLLEKVDQFENLPGMMVKALRYLTVALQEQVSVPGQVLAWFSLSPDLVTAMMNWSMPADDPSVGWKRKTHPLESESFLGPFFSLSPLHSSQVTRYYDPTRSQTAAIQTAATTIQMELTMIWNNLFQTVDRLARSSNTRNWILSWLAEVVNQNHKRAAYQAAQNAVCTDGFMINVTAVVYMLCEPFMRLSSPGTTYPKIGHVDSDYFRRNPLVDIKAETKLGTDIKTADEYYANQDGPKPKAVSDLFFIAMGLQHYALHSCVTAAETYNRMFKDMERSLADAEAGLEQELQPGVRAHMERMLAAYRRRRHHIWCTHHATLAALTDKGFQQGALRVTTFQMVWLLRSVDPKRAYPNSDITLPLPQDAPIEFKALPEYAIDSVISHLKFALSTVPDEVQPHTKSVIVSFCVVFLFQFHYITNPYLTAGLVTVLRYGLPYSNMAGPLDNELKGGSVLACSHLMHALINIFIQVEHTGSQSQFYDKFSIRYEVFEVVDKLWDYEVYRKSLVKECNKDMHFFVRFVNYLLNDATYLLDEAQAAFISIHQLQEELDGMNNLPEDNVEKQEKQAALASAQKKAKSYMPLTNKEIMMLRRFTESLADAFTDDDIVQRLANMLNANLELMVGPKQLQLKVREPAKYSFQPKKLLQDLMGAYVNLRHKNSFIKAIVQDGRSYKPAIFNKARDIATRRDLWDPATMREEWDRMCTDILRAKDIDDNLERMMEGVDVPDDYLDPILFTLMDEPVILPSTKVRINLQTIRSHLLSDPTDPFNRAPLDIKDVVLDTELKEKITAFKAEALEKYLKKQADEAAAAATVSPDVDDSTTEADGQGADLMDTA